MSSSSSSGGSSSPAPPAPGQPQPQAVPIEVDSGSSSSGNSSSSSSSSSSSAGEADEEDEEELTAPKWSAPKGFQLSSASANTAFDWDAIANDPNLELWLFKTPEGVSLPFPSFRRLFSELRWFKQIKGRHMTDVILPEASTSQSTQPIASFQAKKSGFEIVHVPTPAGQDAETEAPQISAEMSRLHPLLPHDGKLQLSMCAPPPLHSCLIVLIRMGVQARSQSADIISCSTKALSQLLPRNACSKTQLPRTKMRSR